MTTYFDGIFKFEKCYILTSEQASRDTRNTKSKGRSVKYLSPKTYSKMEFRMLNDQVSFPTT